MTSTTHNAKDAPAGVGSTGAGVLTRADRTARTDINDTDRSRKASR